MGIRHREDITDVTSGDALYIRTTSETTNHGSFENIGSSKICDDTSVINYGKRIRNGEILNNPCVITHNKLTFFSEGNVALHTDTEENDIYDVRHFNIFMCNLFDTGEPHTDSGFDRVSLRSDMQSKLMQTAKLNALAQIDNTPFAFLEDLAEIKHSIKYLSQIGHQFRYTTKWLLRSEKRIRKGKRVYFSFGNREGHVSTLSDLYLQYRFAISPMVRSTIALLEANNKALEAARLMRPKSPRYTSRGFKAGSVTRMDHWAFNNTWNSRHACTSNIDVTAGILYEKTNPTETFSFKYGLRLKDIPTTMWAIVPYSFIIDRLWNVTNSFKGFINLSDPGIRILAAWERSKEEFTETSTMEANDLYFSSGRIYTDDSRRMTKNWSEFKYSRKPWSPSQSDTIPPSTFGNLVDDFLKLTDIFALGESLLRKQSRF